MVDPLSRHLFPCYKFNLQRQFVNMHATGTGARGAARDDDEGWQRVCLPGLPHTRNTITFSLSLLHSLVVCVPVSAVAAAAAALLLFCLLLSTLSCALPLLLL